MWWAYPVKDTEASPWRSLVVEADSEECASAKVDEELTKARDMEHCLWIIPLASVRGPFDNKGDAMRFFPMESRPDSLKKFEWSLLGELKEIFDLLAKLKQ